METKELRDGKSNKTETTNRSRKVENSRRRTAGRQHDKPGLQEIPDNAITVLSVGETGEISDDGGTNRQEERTQGNRSDIGDGSRDKPFEECDSGGNCIEHRAKKNSISGRKYKRMSRQEKQDIVNYIRWLLELSERSLQNILQGLGLDRNKYNYMVKSLRQSQVVKPRIKRIRLQKPTPEEKAAVVNYVENNPGFGHKRQSYKMLDNNIVALKPYQVYEILKEENMLSYCRKPCYQYTTPAKPKRPNEVWHTDIMYIWVFNRWYYLVDVIDGYSRYLVHWTLNATMHANTVVETMQEALEKLEPDSLKPHIVHDNGKQFLSRQWSEMIEYNDATDVKIRLHHPESNGKIERLHKTHRAECFNGNIESYCKALEMMTLWTDEYNNSRPHSSLDYMTPSDYYYGDPVQKKKVRLLKIDSAKEKRKLYWLNHHEITKLAI